LVKNFNQLEILVTLCRKELWVVICKGENFKKRYLKKICRCLQDFKIKVATITLIDSNKRNIRDSKFLSKFQYCHHLN
jgi:hypothetical protein